MKKILFIALMLIISGCGITVEDDDLKEDYDCSPDPYPDIATYNVIIGDSVAHNLGYYCDGNKKIANYHMEYPLVNRGHGGYSSDEIKGIWQENVIDRQASINTVYVYTGLIDFIRLSYTQQSDRLPDLKAHVEENYKYFKESVSCNVVIISPYSRATLPPHYNAVLTSLEGDVSGMEIMGVSTGSYLHPSVTDDGTHLTKYGVIAFWSNYFKIIESDI